MAPRLQKTPCGRSIRVFHQHYAARQARVLSTMSLALSDVKRIANLSRLELTEAQAGATLDKLNGIFALVEQMQAVDTSGVEPLSHPIAAIEPALALRLREDAVTESNRRDDYQQPAPATQDGLYLVPKVIE
jgi:aspartyl-tRNA(Asn)/glutamyl-tRNA(Gln) amidotransferase subunit C